MEMTKLVLIASLFISRLGFAQELPNVDMGLNPIRGIVSIDGKIRLNSNDWFANNCNSGYGIIASPASGWVNRKHMYNSDYELSFQVVNSKDNDERINMHDWFKFPRWSQVNTYSFKRKYYSGYIYTRSGFPPLGFDRLIVVPLDSTRICFIRLIKLSYGKEDATKKIIHDIISNFAPDSPRANSITTTIQRAIYDGRKTPNTLHEAANELIKILSENEKNHLIKYIKSENDLFSEWPTPYGKVSRLNWILTYWGVNDPTSPLRKDIGLKPGLANHDYLYKILACSYSILDREQEPSNP